jgi:citrate lyase subunit beta/citryl-CoA lyase
MSGSVSPTHVAQALMDLRSLLFVPASASQTMLDRAAEHGADALIVDLEDGVAADRKPEARRTLTAVITGLAKRSVAVLLRVNADPAQWALDLEAVPLERLSAVMLPKVEAAAALDLLASALDAAGAGALPIVALIESPAGVLESASIARHHRVAAIGFGAEDHATALGVAPTPMALAWPAAQVVHAAHAYGRACWGLAASVSEIADLQSFSSAVRDARAIGFTGSVCIHPRQVSIVNAGFSPSADELAWARRVVEADRLARACGLGATQLDGRMIDRPIVQRAQRWLAAEARRGAGSDDSAPAA